MKRVLGCLSFVLFFGVSLNAADNIIMAAERGSVDGVKNFLAAGADINSQDKDGNTALYAASYNGWAEAVKELLTQKADINLANNAGETPLFAAVENNQPEIVDLLLKAGADTNIQNKKGISLVELASQKGYASLAKNILSAGDMEGNNAAFYARTAKELASLKKQGVNLSRKNVYGQTPLFAAVANDNMGTVKYLVRNTADINKGDEKGFTPLMQAVYDKNTEMVDYLLKAKARVNAKTAFGHTALDYTFFLSDFFGYNKKLSDIYNAYDDFSFVTNSHIALQLIKAGASSKTKNDDLLLILISAALGNITQPDGYQIDDIKYILAMPDTIAKEKVSLILVELLNRKLSIVINNAPLVEILLNASEPSVLLKAASFRNLFIGPYAPAFIEILSNTTNKAAFLTDKKLLSSSLLPVIAGGFSDTPEADQDKKVVQFLLDSGADPNYNGTPLVSLAENLGRKDIAQMLEKAGGKRGEISGDNKIVKEISLPSSEGSNYQLQERRRQNLLKDLYGSITDNKNARTKPHAIWLPEPVVFALEEEKEATPVQQDNWGEIVIELTGEPEPSAEEPAPVEVASTPDLHPSAPNDTEAPAVVESATPSAKEEPSSPISQATPSAPVPNTPPAAQKEEEIYF